MKHEDFYLVLPSNSSPLTQPKNTAADYIVDWENPIELDPNSKWKVALSELSYIYSPITISSHYSIRYGKVIQHEKIFTTTIRVRVAYPEQVEGLETDTPFDLIIEFTEEDRSIYDVNFTITLNSDFDCLELNCDRLFIIKCLDDENVFQLPTEYLAENYGWTYRLAGTKKLKGDLFKDYATEGATLEYSTRLKVYGYTYEDSIETFTFPNDVFFNTVKDFVDYLKSKCANIFKDVSLVSKQNVLKLKLVNTIYSITFLGGLNFALGFSNYKFDDDDGRLREKMRNPLLTLDSTTLSGDFPPQLYRGVQNMYIYASICQPIFVGHSSVPLLKNVFVDIPVNDKGLGSVRNYIAYNPMYIPVSTTSIDHIEINIRNDAGQLISFPKAAITSLTLHFRPTINNG